MFPQPIRFNFNAFHRISNRTTNNLYRCKVCEAPASHSNYGAKTCSACKMFFKRYVERGQPNLLCEWNGHCEINVFTRHLCPACRLSKCLTNGMKVELIRCRASRTNQHDNQLMIYSQQTVQTAANLPTLSLLQADQSGLSNDQWNLLSNLIHCYDENSGINFTKIYIKQQLTLPLKMRFRDDSVSHFAGTLFSSAQLLFERNCDFLSLTAHDRSILLRRKMKYTSAFSSTFVVRHSQLLEFPIFYQTTERLFGSNAVAIGKSTVELLDMDVSFMKLALALISFSTFDYTVYDYSSADIFYDLQRINEIQNKYIDLAWRYLLYVYGHRQAVCFFSTLIRSIFNLHNYVRMTQETTTFSTLINSLVDQTEQKLHVES